MKQLIVTADDFGAAHEVNEAVEIAHQRGILTAASLMVTAPALGEAVEIARRNPKLGVGLHLVLVEGRPRLPPSQVNLLVDARGEFRNDMAAAGARMFFVPQARRQLAAEIEAQFAAFAETGLRLDHVNAHKHFHLHPTIAGLILSIGQRYGLRAARVPDEPAAPLRAAEPAGDISPAYVTGPWASLLRARYRAAGLLIPDQVFGLRWSGAITEQRLRGIVENLPKGLSEIYLHPATASGFAGSAPGYRYTDEFQALISRTVLDAAHSPGVQLGSFADFLDRSGSVNSAAEQRMRGSTHA
ncbi:MAG: hopanoid biosynthesis-associated protein HpnK [Alphaproteobacteria bacterium]